MENCWDGDVYVYNGGQVHRRDKRRITNVVISFVRGEKLHFQAFERCRSLVRVDIPSMTDDDGKQSSLIEINNRAFCECPSLTYIGDLPTCLQRIGKKAFFKCGQLMRTGFEHWASYSTPSTSSTTSLKVIGRDA